MRTVNLNQRIGVFVDVANLYYSAKNLYQRYVDFGRVLKGITAGRQLVRAIAYAVKADIEPEEAFFEALRQAGFEVKTKELQIFADGTKKADWDVGLALDAIKIAPHLDGVVIVSGDGDFIPLVDYLKENRGCRVEVAAFGRTASKKLIEAADSFWDLGEGEGNYLISSRKGR